MKKTHPNFQISWHGPIVIIGFGSIGRAILPLLFRHLKVSGPQVTVIDPNDQNKPAADAFGARFLNIPLTKENYRAVLTEVFTCYAAQPLIVNVSTNVSSKDIIAYAHSANALYVDTSIDPWPGVYFNKDMAFVERSNYSLRESLREFKDVFASGPTAVSCCGANPGMVSWFVKQAILDIARDTIGPTAVPTNREQWARLVMKVGIKGIHVAERDAQQPALPRRPGEFLNTWSAEGFLAEALQPAELGWGSHEKAMPPDGHTHMMGCGASIYLDRPGGNQKIMTWTPSHGEHFGFLISHNEAISIADYFTVRNGGDVVYRPTCLYAYRPTDVAVESLVELFQTNRWHHDDLRVLGNEEIIEGFDELGVLVYGHAKNAYWYGSKLSIQEARSLAPHQNATSLQVSSALLAGIVWAINHPNEGLVETDEIDFEQCLETQRPYLGTLSGCYTDWHPQEDNVGAALTGLDRWQFSHMRL